MNLVGQQLVLSRIVPFRANIITWQSILLSLLTNMVVQSTQLESRFCSSKDGWTRHSRGLDDKIFFVAFQRRRKAYQSTSFLQQSETLKDARSQCFFSFVCQFVCFFMFLCVLPKKGVIIPGRAFHKLLGNFLATSGIWSNFLILFRTTFCFLSNFSRSLVILRYRNSLYCLNSSFLKRSQILLPGADHG